MNSPAPSRPLADPRRLALLRSLRDDGPAPNQRALARRCGLSEPAVSTALHPLRALGLVVARRDPDTRGSVSVRIAPAGLEELAEAEADRGPGPRPGPPPEPEAPAPPPSPAPPPAPAPRVEAPRPADRGPVPALTPRFLDRGPEALAEELAKALAAYVEAKERALPGAAFRERLDRLDALMAAWPGRSFAHPRLPLVATRCPLGELVVARRGKTRGPMRKAR